MTRPDLPDGTYLRWRGRLRPAHSTSFRRMAVLLELDPGETVPSRYERDEGSERWIYVPLSELEEHFSLTTYCEWMGMRCHVGDWTAEDRIVIDVALIGSDRAAELEMRPTFEREQFIKELPVSEVTDLRQERTEIRAG